MTNEYIRFVLSRLVMNTGPLDTDLLRTFAAVVDHSAFTRAAERLFLTQSGGVTQVQTIIVPERQCVVRASSSRHHRWWLARPCPE
jgi:hypothetical protein